MLFKTIHENSGKLKIHAVCACQKIKSDQKLVTYINDHINPITLFGVHVNTTFGFDNQNEFIRMEAKSVHVNVANDSYLQKYVPVFFNVHSVLMYKM